MEISWEIIANEIYNIEKHYKGLEELFATKTIPQYKQINETIENLSNIKKSKKYPDLKSKYSWLGECSKQTIYIFSVENFPYDEGEIEKKFEEIKSLKDEKKVLLPRINKISTEWKNIKINKAVCLYVGSSENIAQRLKEHLFFCNKGVYAMHLESWFPKELPVTINVWDFYDLLGDDEYGYLQIIEDFLWNHYKPLLGRQGKK